MTNNSFLTSAVTITRPGLIFKCLTYLHQLFRNTAPLLPLGCIITAHDHTSCTVDYFNDWVDRTALLNTDMMISYEICWIGVKWNILLLGLYIAFDKAVQDCAPTTMIQQIFLFIHREMTICCIKTFCKLEGYMRTQAFLWRKTPPIANKKPENKGPDKMAHS